MLVAACGGEASGGEVVEARPCRPLAFSIPSGASRSNLRRVFSVQDHRLRRSRLPQRALEAVGVLASLCGPGRCVAIPMMFDSLVQDQLPMMCALDPTNRLTPSAYPSCAAAATPQSKARDRGPAQERLQSTCPPEGSCARRPQIMARASADDAVRRRRRQPIDAKLFLLHSGIVLVLFIHGFVGGAHIAPQHR